MIVTTPFSPAISDSLVSRAASEASSLGERTKADPYRFAGSSVKHVHILTSFDQSSCFTLRNRNRCFGAA